jgi:predicted TIM-barrel fold metal-dependent hydrolase
LGATTRGIDIHHHFLPPSFVEALAQAGHPAAAQAEALAWSPEGSLAMMDASGIETAILSLSLPGASFPGAADPAALARQSNEYAARLIADYPGRFGTPSRFGAFASLPMLEAQPALDAQPALNARAALAELEHALDRLKLDGVMLLSNVRGRYLGDPAFDALLAELNRRRATVFLHPNQAPGPGLNDFVEFPHEVTRALASLTESGAIERYPRIRYILAYGGGTIPFIASRVTIVGMDVFGSFLKTMIRYLQRVRTMQRMSYDLTASTDPFAWRALYGHTVPTRILMGSNFPWTSPAAFARQQAELRASEDLDRPHIEAIERGNSLKLFPRFA